MKTYIFSICAYIERERAVMKKLHLILVDLFVTYKQFGHFYFFWL